VELNGLGQFPELLDQFTRRGHQAAKTDEGPHNLDIHPHGFWRTQHAGEHGHALFSKDPGKITFATVTQT